MIRKYFSLFSKQKKKIISNRAGLILKCSIEKKNFQFFRRQEKTLGILVQINSAFKKVQRALYWYIQFYFYFSIDSISSCDRDPSLRTLLIPSNTSSDYFRFTRHTSSSPTKQKQWQCLFCLLSIGSLARVILLPEVFILQKS